MSEANESEVRLTSSDVMAAAFEGRPLGEPPVGTRVAELEAAVERLEGEVTRLRCGTVVLGQESEAWYLALQMLVARLIDAHLPAAAVAGMLAEITTDVCLGFQDRLVHERLRYLDSVARVMLAGVRDVVRERAGDAGEKTS